MFTVNNVLEATKQSSVFDIVNAIRNSSSPFYQSMVPLASAENVASVGDAITMNPQLQNEFISSLVNRIGLVIIRNTMLKNPLSQFKSGTMALGDTIEDIFVDLTKEHLYDVEKSEDEFFRREVPNVHTLYHKLNRKGFYKQTIQEDSLKQAFVSEEKLGSFMASVIQAMHNSAEVDEYKYMKLLLSNYYAKGHFKVVPLGANPTDAEIIQYARTIATYLTMPQGSRDFNSLAVHTRTLPENLYVLMTPERAASIDVNVLASAFNMDKTSFIGKRIIMDDLGSNPETGEKIEMLIFDANLIMVKDNNIKMTSKYNPEGLYWNYWLHVWQLLSSCRFANAVALVSGDVAPIQEVTINPEIFELRDGKSRELIAHVRTPHGQSYDGTVTWSVIDAQTLQTVSTGLTVTPGTNTSQATVAITDASLLGDDVIIQATATYTVGEGEEVETISVFGRSYLHINKN